ncbi:MAG: hypothetical protein GC187_02170 [Alphaproteobacteria bacterium]|nr:hypothetical protein [Alphaproteobacteria bacterium]
MTKKVLIYTDSRGQHTPRGVKPFPVFAERLAQRPDLDVELALCPMKWTTTLDFLEFMKDRDPSHWDHIILYTGIVEWSPRPQNSAINDLYDNNSPNNLGNEGLNTRDYSKKVVNNKKAIFDAVFGEGEIISYLSSDLGVEYEGQPTVNMYSLDMARQHLAPRLKEIQNLIFINSNRFVVGWEGDFARGRPANIALTETYSEVFRDLLGPERVIDLLAWDERAITELTCDNLHLTQAGHTWIYDVLIERLSIAMNPGRKARTASKISVNRANDYSALEKFKSAIGAFDQCSDFYNKRKTVSRTVEAGIPGAHADFGYLNIASFMFCDETISNIASCNKNVLDDISINALVQNLYGSHIYAKSYINNAYASYQKRWHSEYRFLTVGKVDSFPYNYFSGYSYRAHSNEASDCSLDVEFIYCIKNRRCRTAISVNSLMHSFDAYRSTGGNYIKPIVTVVEDVSEDVFDPNQTNITLPLNHIVLNTGIAWTRSGILNVGIRNSHANIIALVDSDFIFHEGYLKALETYLTQCDWRRSIIANNLIETEAHKKGEVIYSASSPYSYMWMAPRTALDQVRGFDEGYTGHGWEDRDLELKLVRLCGLRVADTASIVPECVVLHLSHTSRDGYESHQVNRSRYRLRQEGDADALRQEAWGEQEVLWSASFSPSDAPGATSLALGPSFAPRRYKSRPLKLISQSRNFVRNLYMVISCAAYTERQEALFQYYNSALPDEDGFVFIVGGASRNWYDPLLRTMYITAGDSYEDLPEKVLKAITLCVEHFKFRHLIKIDDDVIANFSLLSRLIESFESPYFGKMIPSKRGAKPSPTWHIGKVSDRSPYFGKPFNFEGGPANWCCGGMYALARGAADTIHSKSESMNPTEYLYEDHMIGSMLHLSGIEPHFIEETESLSDYRFIQTDLREILDGSLENINNSELLMKVGAVHCGPFPPLYDIPKSKCLALMSLFAAQFNPSKSGVK